jgi:PTS system nitrogen regulatory IIA component
MDLKIKDVAELLSVSETTIRRWLSDGKIPAYRLNDHQYRFSRIEIENWMMKCKLKHSCTEIGEQIYPVGKQVEQENGAGRSGMQQFALYRAIHQGDILTDIDEKHKNEIIKRATEEIAPKLRVDVDILSEQLLDREKMMPTAFNHGVGVPHAREILRTGPYDRIFVLFLKKPIEYGALDGEPVHTLFFLFACSDKSHLHLLSKLAHFSNNKECLSFLRSLPDKKRVLEFVKEWEAALRISP